MDLAGDDSSKTEPQVDLYPDRDGEPDYIDNTKIAITEAQRLGYEIYGLGLDSDSIKGLLTGRSAVIKQLADLPQAMFRLLGAALTRKEQ